MDLTVKRFEFGTNYTIGKLLINGVEECFTLEDKVQEVQGQPVSTWKIAGETAIPVGKYKVIVDFSNRFQALRPHILDVPGFDGIRIHSGNTDKDTEGCILLGEFWPGGDKIINSMRAYTKFIAKLNEAIANKEDVWITVE